MILLYGMRVLKHLFSVFFLCAMIGAPLPASADLIDGFNLAPFIPNLLEVLMMMASGTYEYFVGADARGPLYVLIWAGTAISVGLYLVKLYLPKTWGSIFGFTGGGEMRGGIDGMTIVQNVLKPGFRAILAIVLLLQVRPTLLTKVLVNPFLEVGSVYTEYVLDGIRFQGDSAYNVDCPQEILEQGWLSQRSCEFLVKPVSRITSANNRLIKRGFEYLADGLRTLLTLIPHGGEGFVSLVTGIILIFTFASSNVFMAMLIIQGIFNFGMSLLLYPFQVLTYVFKASDKWFDIWPAFNGVIKALQELVITMIASAFILSINIAIVVALFPNGASVYVDVAGGSATGNVPTLSTGMVTFGQHSITILSSLLTFYLMLKIFNMTQEQLKQYTKGQDGMYNQVVGDSKALYGKYTNTKKKIKDWFDK